MDLVKATMYILVVMMSINAVSYMMTHVGMVYMDPYNATAINEALNPNDIVDSYTETDPQFYNIGAALVAFWSRTVPIIEEFPHMLAVFGTPEFIYLPLLTIWRFIWVGALSLGIIAGRST